MYLLSGREKCNRNVKKDENGTRENQRPKNCSSPIALARCYNTTQAITIDFQGRTTRWGYADKSHRPTSLQDLPPELRQMIFAESLLLMEPAYESKNSPLLEACKNSHALLVDALEVYSNINVTVDDVYLRYYNHDLSRYYILGELGATIWAHNQFEGITYIMKTGDLPSSNLCIVYRLAEASRCLKRLTIQLLPLSDSNFSKNIDPETALGGRLHWRDRAIRRYNMECGGPATLEGSINDVGETWHWGS
ncbi:hypothetical protein B0J14DRAFT_686781 [Halenospora varia]|nr:hypothetical protein B0J14DRAFT_686781 [Halenospora varia]